jgi:hypothetical protein
MIILILLILSGFVNLNRKNVKGTEIINRIVGLLPSQLKQNEIKCL